jgi:hypothetical protein
MKHRECFTKYEREVLHYCYKHIDHMWAACVAGIILECEFRDAKLILKALYDTDREK